MTKIEMHKGRWLLPIIGDRVTDLELQLSCWTIRFRAHDDVNSSLRIEEKGQLTRGSQQYAIDLHGDSKQFTPVVELLGSDVTNAYATKHGVILIEFSNALTLTVGAITECAWHFHSPRPGTGRHGENCLKAGAGALF